MCLTELVAHSDRLRQDDNQYSSYCQFESRTLIQPVAY